MAHEGTVAIVAIGVSGGVSLVAAIVAPITAHRRQERALAAESGRQARQLAHDRLLRDLEDARTRLDDVIDMSEAALSAIFQARADFKAANQPMGMKHMSDAQQYLGQFGHKERRIRVRLGHDHDLIAGLADYRVAVQSLYDLTHGCVTQGDEVPDDAWNACASQIAAAQVGAIQIAERSLGARIHPD